MTLKHICKHQYTIRYLSAWVGGDHQEGGTYVKFYFEFAPMTDSVIISAAWNNEQDVRLNDYITVRNKKDMEFGKELDYEAILLWAVENYPGFPGNLHWKDEEFTIKGEEETND